MTKNTGGKDGARSWTYCKTQSNFITLPKLQADSLTQNGANYFIPERK